MENRKFGAFSSSENPEQLGDTVKGILIGCSTIIIFIFGHYVHINITIDQITAIAETLGTAITAIWTLYGLVKKLFIKVIV